MNREKAERYRWLVFREVEGCELAVVFFGSVVVCPGGLDLIVERAEEYGSAVDHNLCLPELVFAVADDAFVF